MNDTDRHSVTTRNIPSRNHVRCHMNKHDSVKCDRTSQIAYRISASSLMRNKRNEITNNSRYCIPINVLYSVAKKK